MIPLVAFRVGNEPFYTFTLLVDLGLLVAVAALTSEGRRRGWSHLEVLEMLAWAVAPALVAGRVAYLVGLRMPLWPPQPWGEGLSFAGALAGGAAGLACLAGLHRRRYSALLSAILPGLALGQALGWLGAAAHGAQAGVAMPPSTWWAPHLRDLYGVGLPRFPLQYLAAGLSALAWAVMVRGRLGDAGRAACYALLTGCGLAALGAQLERRQALVAGLTLDQAIYIALGGVGLAIALAGLWRRIAQARSAGRAAR